MLITAYMSAKQLGEKVPLEEMNLSGLYSERVDADLYKDQWAPSTKQHQIYLQRIDCIKTLMNEKVTEMSFTTVTTLEQMSIQELEKEKKKYEKTLDFFNPRSDYPEPVRLTEEHIARIETYIKRAKMWKLVGVNNDDDTTEQ